MDDFIPIDGENIGQAIRDMLLKSGWRPPRKEPTTLHGLSMGQWLYLATEMERTGEQGYLFDMKMRWVEKHHNQVIPEILPEAADALVRMIIDMRVADTMSRKYT